MLQPTDAVPNYAGVRSKGVYKEIFIRPVNKEFSSVFADGLYPYAWNKTIRLSRLYFAVLPPWFCKCFSFELFIDQCSRSAVQILIFSRSLKSWVGHTGVGAQWFFYLNRSDFIRNFRFSRRGFQDAYKSEAMRNLSLGTSYTLELGNIYSR